MKKALSLILAALIAAAFLPCFAAPVRANIVEEVPEVFDADGDGEMTSADVLEIAKHLAPEGYDARFDADGDGDVDRDDLLAAAQSVRFAHYSGAAQSGNAPSPFVILPVSYQWEKGETKKDVGVAIYNVSAKRPLTSAFFRFVVPEGYLIESVELYEDGDRVVSTCDVKDGRTADCLIVSTGSGVTENYTRLASLSVVAECDTEKTPFALRLIPDVRAANWLGGAQSSPVGAVSLLDGTNDEWGLHEGDWSYRIVPAENENELAGAAVSRYYGDGKTVEIPEQIGGFEVRTVDRYVFATVLDVVSVSIPASVRTIADFVFNGTLKLAEVNYGGDYDQWTKIRIGDNNSPLYSAQIVLKDGGHAGTPPPTVGDVNRDGRLNAKDVIAIMKHIVGVTVKGFDEERADVNGDGKTNAKDVLTLMKYIIGG